MLYIFLNSPDTEVPVLTPVTTTVLLDCPARSKRPSDRLEPPAGVSAKDVRRSLELEFLRDEAPDLPPEKLRRIASIREQLRMGTYVTRERLGIALGRAVSNLP